MNKFKFLAKNKISNLPKGTGVYCFKKGREILYIGKAINIKERVKNHFQKISSQSPAAQNAARETKRIGYIKTNSEIEALILEAQLIKKYQPKYNVMWRDDKNFFYVAATKEDFPRLFITHQPNLKFKVKSFTPLDTKSSNGARKLKVNFVGPFVDGKSLKTTLKILRKVFPFRSCRVLPKKPCLWYQLDRCPAPCLTKSKLSKQLPKSKIKMKKECQKNVKNLIKILLGKKKQVLNQLKKEMKQFSKKEQFERAGKVRDQIASLEYVLSHSRTSPFCCYALEHSSKIKDVPEEIKKVLNLKKSPKRIEAYDVSNIQGQSATGAMASFSNGKPDKNFYRRFRIKYTNSTRSFSLRSASRNTKARIRIGKPNDIAMLKEMLWRRLKHKEWPLPDLILIDGGKAQLNAAIKTRNEKQETRNKIKLMSLAKRKNKLYLEGKKEPILLKNLSKEISNLILYIRDEAHRFAITYHKKLRKKKLFE